MNLVLRFNVLKELDVMAGSCNPNTGEAETGKALLFPDHASEKCLPFSERKDGQDEDTHNLLSCGHHTSINTYVMHMYSCIDRYSSIIIYIIDSASFSSYLETVQQYSHHPTQPDQQLSPDS